MIDEEERINLKTKKALATYSSGVIFGIGWWIFIAVSIIEYKEHPNEKKIGGEWVIGIVSTIGLIMINSLNWTDLEMYRFYDYEVDFKNRLWLAVSAAILGVGVVSSVWVAIQVYIGTGNNGDLIGSALICQNVLIFISAVIFNSTKHQVINDI